jgi:hypothetical protein
MAFNRSSDILIVPHLFRWLSNGLSRRECLDGERMDPISKEAAERIVDETMSFEAVSACKCRRNDKQSEVAFAGTGRAGVSRVQVRFIDDVETGRLEGYH